MSQSTNITFQVWEEEFKKAFPIQERWGSYPHDSIMEFIQDMETPLAQNPLKAELKANLDEEQHDSYGNEDSTLKRVYYFPEYDLYVMFSGKRESHNGEYWDEMKEVKPTTKTYEVYE